jgi:hypothetical protein
MKTSFLLILALIAVSPIFTGCQTIKNDEARSEGISGEGVGMTRDDVYNWQDRTFRQLAY